MARLGDIVEQIRGVSYKPEDVYAELTDESVALLRANNIKDGYLDLQDIIYVDKRRVKANQYLRAGDILVCTSSGSKALVGKAAYVESNLPMAFGAFCKVVRPTIEFPKYLGHFFDSPYYRKKISDVSAGANINNIRNEHIDEIEIQLPSIKAQKHIISILNKTNCLIALRKQQLAKLDELVKARFVEMFGASKTNSKRWVKKRLETIAFVGSSKRVFVEELQDTGIPFYRGTEIGALATGETVIPDLFITEKHYNELCTASGTPKRGDLLMPSICPDGRIWCVDTDEPFYFKDGRVLWIHPTDNIIENTYLLYALKEKLISDYINIASGTTFVELKIFALKGLEIMIPPLPLQKSFSDFIQAVHTEQLTIQQGLDKLKTMKNALMQQYFG